MNRTLIIVRTHRADAPSLAAYERYATIEGADVVFCVDERAGPVDFSGRPKVGFDRDKLLALGLYAHPNCGWRCGDYCFYVTRAARPDYDFYWLIEPDVRINTRDLNAFMAPFAAQKHDFLAPNYRPRDEHWYWTRTILPTGLAPYGCLYPITRLSARAIDHMLDTRRAHSADSRLATADAWPNDEVFTASVLSAGGFVCADINEVQLCASAETMTVSTVTDPAILEGGAPDGMIYHPVRDFGPFLGAAEQRAAAFREEARSRGARYRPRPEARFLNDVAQACLRHPVHHGSALVPLMLAQDLWQRDSCSEAPLLGTAKAGEEKALAFGRLLHRHFRAGEKRVVATAHLAELAGSPGPEKAASDFVRGVPVPIGRFPVSAALPYAFDMRDGSLLLTAHISAELLLSRVHLVDEQRRRTRAVMCVSRADLPLVREVFVASGSGVAVAALAMLENMGGLP